MKAYLKADGPSCIVCTHLNVCALYRAVEGFLANWKTKKPMEARDLAKLCIEYTPIVLPEVRE